MTLLVSNAYSEIRLANERDRLRTGRSNRSTRLSWPETWLELWIEVVLLHSRAPMEPETIGG